MTSWNAPSQEDIENGALKIANTFKGWAAAYEQPWSESGPAPPPPPFFIGRNGTIEIEVLYYYLIKRKNPETRDPYPDRLLTQIQRHAGVFPSTPESLDGWCAEYLESLESLTGLAAGWYKPLWHIENGILCNHTEPDCFRTPLRSLEPYYHKSQLWWTQYLKGRRVTVINSFTESMEYQIISRKIERVWRGEREGLLDIIGVDWSFVRTGYAPTLALGNAGWPAGIDTWDKAVTYCVEKAVETRPDVVLIGCGGLGMIIGARLKNLGISAYVMGGAIQILFGIKGRRWESHDVISRFWNSAWVWPAPNEVPRAAEFIEGGCYWGLHAT
jgi:hypothetical protein